MLGLFPPQRILHWPFYVDLIRTALFCYTDLNLKRDDLGVKVLWSLSLWVGLVQMGTIGSILVYNTGQGSAGGIPHTEGLHTRTWFILRNTVILTHPPIISLHVTNSGLVHIHFSPLWVIQTKTTKIQLNTFLAFSVICHIVTFSDLKTIWMCSTKKLVNY